jgi:hypothetical protein
MAAKKKWQKTCLFYLKQNIVFFTFFFCLKHVLNYYVAVLLHSTTGHAHCAIVLQCKLRNYRNADFLLFSRVIL